MSESCDFSEFCENSSSHRMPVRIEMEFVFTIFSLSLYSQADGSIEETISTSTKKKCNPTPTLEHSCWAEPQATRDVIYHK